jgi:hypothetical protein
LIVLITEGRLATEGPLFRWNSRKGGVEHHDRGCDREGEKNGSIGERRLRWIHMSVFLSGCPSLCSYSPPALPNDQTLPQHSIIAHNMADISPDILAALLSAMQATDTKPEFLTTFLSTLKSIKPNTQPNVSTAF